MLARAATAALLGIDAFRVDLEVDFARRGMPAFTMVGLAEGAVRESKERVFAALKNCGFSLPPARITVNLAPADVRKEGSAYDLPLALALLAASGVLDPERLAGFYFAGELSLTGELKPVNGVLPLAILARDEGARGDGTRGVLVPPDNASEASVVQDVPVYGPPTLAAAVRFLAGEDGLAPAASDIASLWGRREIHPLDFADVKGQEHAKRAVEIAAAGGHNLLFIGPPGSGKTMLAQRIPSVMPPLGFNEALDVTKIYSVAGRLDKGQALVVTRPFRNPHHTISDAGLIGGGQIPRPGEVSLAHRGVLFLDELPEFKKHVLEVLRQPLEDGKVTISRAAVSLDYPADFMLVAAMNPCPCGYHGDERHPCRCTPLQVSAYRSRLSGPLLDRIDLHVEVPAVPYKDLKQVKSPVGSAAMRGRIEAARSIQAERFAGTGLLENAQLTGERLSVACGLGSEEHGFLEKAVHALGLSARAYTRILRIARTIADLEPAPAVRAPHLAEAIQYRSLDRETAL
ncbi:MAG: YifB family Mg chelatase-like AAA ATPase [Thermodesulfobacteriota bacterium]